MTETPTAPAPTTKATVKVNSHEFRTMLKSVAAHHRKGQKEDAIAQHRVRLVFANGVMFIAACNEQTTALGKLKYLDDTRGDIWEPTDAPLIADLQPRHVPLICAWLSARAVGADGDPLVAITIDVFSGEIELEDLGGLWSSGERQAYQLTEPHEAFPDVIALTGRALNEVAGEGERQKPLVQDGAVLALFAVASKQLGAQARIRATGSAEQRGFVVQVGPGFIGTVESRHGDDDGLKTRERIDAEWRRLLGGNLRAVAI